VPVPVVPAPAGAPAPVVPVPPAPIGPAPPVGPPPPVESVPAPVVPVPAPLVPDRVPVVLMPAPLMPERDELVPLLLPLWALFVDRLLCMAWRLLMPLALVCARLAPLRLSKTVPAVSDARITRVFIIFPSTDVICYGGSNANAPAALVSASAAWLFYPPLCKG